MLPGSDLLAVPLGYILWFFYRYIGNYFLSIFLFTLVVRAATFPLALKSQKMQAERARLAPRLERLQKKYARDKKKLQEKQMKLYEKEGVSLTGGCMPMIIQMIVLFGVIAVIYKPLSNLTRIPSEVIEASLTAVAQDTEKNDEGKVVDIPNPNKLSTNERSKNYIYRELRLLMVIDNNKQDVIDSIGKLSEDVRKNVSAEEYYKQMINVRKDFNFFGKTLLENPWNEKGIKGINILWIIPLISWLTALASSYISMRFMNATQGSGQPGQGCQNNSMLLVMPLFSLFITFRVPGGVGVYWISSNIIAIIQTIILNQIYNPAKIREQAEIEYQERRRKKLEDKKRLAEARARENAELNAANQAAGKASKKSKPKASSNKPKDTNSLNEKKDTTKENEKKESTDQIVKETPEEKRADTNENEDKKGE